MSYFSNMDYKLEKFRTLDTRRHFEIRSYPDYVKAEVPVQAVSYQEALEVGDEVLRKCV